MASATARRFGLFSVPLLTKTPAFSAAAIWIDVAFGQFGAEVAVGR